MTLSNSCVANTVTLILQCGPSSDGREVGGLVQNLQLIDSHVQNAERMVYAHTTRAVILYFTSFLYFTSWHSALPS